MNSIDAPAPDLAAMKRAHDAAYQFAMHAHMDGCQIPPEVIYQSAFVGSMLANELAKPLHRAAFAVVGTMAAFRDAFASESGQDVPAAS